MSPDPRARVVEGRFSALYLHSTRPCVCRHAACPSTTEVPYAPHYKAALVENSVRIMKDTGNRC